MEILSYASAKKKKKKKKKKKGLTGLNFGTLTGHLKKNKKTSWQ